MEAECNVCGGKRFGDQRTRKGVRCMQCGSLERTRVLQLVLFESAIIRPGLRVMHLAPELGIARNVKKVVGKGYEPYDLFPEKFRGLEVRKMNLVTDVEGLPSEHYDVIVHSHVMEHIACDATAVFFHLHRSLRSSGRHVFCVPIRAGYYEAQLGGLTAEERTRRFGQDDHVRLYGARDLGATLGMIFKLPAEYDLEKQFSAGVLDKFNIPKNIRKGFNSSSVLALRKEDIKLHA
jgi:hypothetical protein